MAGLRSAGLLGSESRVDPNDQCLYRMSSGCLSSFYLTIESLQVRNNHSRTRRVKRKLNLALRNDLVCDKFELSNE